jgi:hypothetical protein
MDTRKLQAVMATVILTLGLVPTGPAAGEGRPTTYLGLYVETYECGLYLTYMATELRRSGAPEDVVEFYGDRAAPTPWLLFSIGEVLSEADWVDAETRGRQLEHRFQEITSHQDDVNLDAMKAEYDARCIQAIDNFSETVAAIRRRLEIESGEPFIELKGQCVTVSTDLLTLTGVYWGMVGPSIKDVPTGGIDIPDPKSGDRIKVKMGARGVGSTMEYVPYAESTTVERVPDEECAEFARFVATQYRDSPPDDPGPHRIEVRAVDCSASSPDPGGTAMMIIEIAGNDHLDVLDIEISSLNVPGMTLDTSGGPPCELLHGSPTTEEYADLRCRFGGDRAVVPAVEETMEISGRFVNGVPFAGSFEVCQP